MPSPKPPAFTTYKTFILASERFSVGDTVAVRSPGSVKDYIAAIERIHTDKDAEVMIDCRWYYRPEETAMGRQPWNGEDELIDSDHVDTFHVRCVNSRCKILTMADYEAYWAGGHKVDTQVPVYFCRSKYLKKLGKLEKPLPTYCACKQPQKPEASLIQCDKCDKWYFGKCIGLTSMDAGSLSSWMCPLCTPEDENGKRKERTDDLLDKVRRGECSPWDHPFSPVAGKPKFSKKRRKNKT
mmetsp:Transcript_4491/g.11462  ORF Transcript_4491/g.11462 Transcript_4491/m.11462 type:complete len:240 (+) Transcript_4491:341-1060(+)|eukprot:CAMPEP_0182927380 /NCGR_PEP_ID=MMETSP0105_2-20130417/13756_1 /TAXON_ID=81532 ORGANISM="Acanthoeca-like sp., Strain 10tr" /NCGR_SAMPLE_ID=MMETSP0105_2 /ASSEMBLY_ACC=CAM_ASM_000205 /LENGTH=239 /DNA_ID=CAMNT_0025065325 /DNA_START=341 /DNA_END=1060 /DNA_ORIENTATION=-